jgi:peptidoglycan hydrolase CwlO-like protein
MISNVVSNVVAMASSTSGLSPAQSILSTLNWNLLISVFAICLTALGTLIKIFGENRSDYEHTAKQMDKISNDLDTLHNKENDAQKEINKVVANMQTEIATLKVQVDNNTKNLDELKTDTKKVVARLDDLLQQLIDWMN